MRHLDPTQPIELAADEGILVIHTATDIPITRLDLDGVRLLGEIPAGTRFELFAAKEGRHRFSRALVVERDDEEKPIWFWRFRIKDEPHWAFTVTAGKINYPGQFVVYTDGQMQRRRSRFQLSNRTALAWTHIQSKYPHLLDAYPFEYVGSVRDDFLEEFLASEDAE